MNSIKNENPTPSSQQNDSGKAEIPKKPKLRFLEKRKHPRFLLSGEQFKETRTRRIFSVYDLSFSGLSIKVEEQHWPIGTVISGILNLHPDSIEMPARVIGYYGDRAALKIESLSTYARTVLARGLSAPRLGKSLVQVKERVGVADQWFHGVCNTDVLLRLSPECALLRIEIFFSNFYFSWNGTHIATGHCQSFGRDKYLIQPLATEPVTMESLELILDATPDYQQVDFARSIVEASNLDQALKRAVLEKIR